MAYFTGMTLRPILIHPDPRLKAKCAPLEDITDALRAQADDMLQTMYDAPGIGLAAPQIGVTNRMIVMDCIKDKEQPPRPMVLVNPVVLSSSDERNTYEEGCLSIPDQFAEVERPAEVEVQWMTLDGTETREVFTGLWATCVQHEIDHLDGVLFIDHLGPMKRRMMTKKSEKLKRELARG